MLTMLLEMGLYVLGAVVLLYLVYALFFASGSASKKSAPEQKTKSSRRFERREGETGDRRKKDIGPPPGTPERRKGSRRSRD